MKKKSVLKRIIKTLCIVLCVLILVVAGYVAYVFIDFHRIGDMDVAVEGEAAGIDKKELSIVTYNIGFGAYESDYGFFMDGGTEAWAWSEERLDKNLNNIAALLEQQHADFYIIQEVDTDSTRSYHVDQRPYLTKALTGKDYTFAQNYDSAFLFYPLYQPIGASESGLMTFSSMNISSAERIELPIESGLTKLLDLDRCYAKHFIDLNNGKKFVLYNFHLSAYTSDGTIANEQLKLVLDDMQNEYSKGNYCIAGGDFNKDILGDSSIYFGISDIKYTWAQPIPDGLLDDYDVTLIAPLDKSNPIPTCRNADSVYHPWQYVLTIDGFMVTDNVTVKSCEVIDTKFAYSDHNPVKMIFEFNE